MAFPSFSYRSVAVLVTGLLLPLTLMVAPTRAAAASDCGPNVNKIACENSKPGSPRSEWDISGAGDPSIQGFATTSSVNVGQTVHFKIDTKASTYTIDIYRTGYYGGRGARKVAQVAPSVALPQSQPNCLTEAATGLVDCGNWQESASWEVPADAVSGVYVAKLTAANGDSSHIIFTVRDDASGSDIVFQTSDTTWQAYNTYGGNSFYQGSPAGRAYKLSYNRPYATRGLANGRDFYFASEYAMVQFLEANGYDVSYVSGLDVATNAPLLRSHKTYLSVGHDEYWSGSQRTNVEAARDASVNLAFFSGNEVYWRTRLESAISPDHTANRTLVCYKETWANAKIDPSSEWTGTWRDGRFASPAQGGDLPENGLTGTAYKSNTGQFAIQVPADDGKLRLWRNTSVASQAAGDVAALGPDTLGYEFDEDLDNGHRPAGLIRLSSTTKDVQQYLVDEGNEVVPASATHHLTQYRADSGALVFGAGTIQWSWGLGMPHDGQESPATPAMQQATVNLLADMSAQPTTLLNTLQPATKSTDTAAPTAEITSPAASAVNGTKLTVRGTASDTGGGRVGGIEVSVDSGATWHPADGRETWTYKTNVGSKGTYDIRARATDDSGNIGVATPQRPTTVDCPCSMFGDSVPRSIQDADTAQIELGTDFTSAVDGYVTGVRFYKGPSNSGTHVGRLYSSSGSELAKVTFTGESDKGWQSADFAAPVPISAGQTYTVSYTAPQGRYSSAAKFYAAGPFAKDPLTAVRGVYRYGTPGTRPTDTYNNENYWVGADFATDVVDTTPPAVVDTSPNDGATGVSLSKQVAATFDEVITAGARVTLTPQGGSAVTGETTWDAATKKLTFTPSAALAATTKYTASVTGVADTAGNAMAPYEWSFTTGSATSGTTVSLFGNTMPTNPQDSDTSSVELGTKFSATLDGYVTGVRFYKGSGNNGTHVGRLYSPTGTVLATVTFTGESASGWQTAAFPSPVAIQAGSTYTVGYLAPVGRYAYDSGFFASPFTQTPLTATQGVYRYGAGGTMPTSTWNNTNYWVGVDFSTTAQDTTAPTVTATTPVNQATAVPRSTQIAAVLSEAIKADAAITVTAQGGADVTGTTAWDASAKTLSFTPSTALSPDTTYSVRISGVADQAGNTMPPYSWTFTTAPPAGNPAPVSLFGNTTPTNAAANDTGAVELGTQFTTSKAGTVSGIRFYKGTGNTGTHIGRLYSSDGSVLATVTFTGETSAGWQTAALATPVQLAAGQTYTVSYFAPVGRYAYDSGFFASPFTQTPLTAAKGVYRYGTGGVVPASSWNNTNYWVGVDFTETPA